MCREGDPGLGLERGQNRRLFAGFRRVGENDDVAIADGEGVLDAELIAEFGPDPAVAGQSFDDPRAQTVVAAAGIPDAEDKDRQRDLDASVRPAPSTISTVSGIAPRAWVAQLRHGS